MAGDPEATPPDDGLDELLADPDAQAWFEKHRNDLRQEAYGPRLLYSILTLGFVLGLAAYVAGYLIRSTAPAEPFGLLADLLYGLGLALWTGIVVVVFVQVLPEAKRRQIKRALEGYEAIRRERPRQSGDGSSRG
jgi:F0F1-type ATP synthase assembly protein I